MLHGWEGVLGGGVIVISWRQSIPLLYNITAKILFPGTVLGKGSSSLVSRGHKAVREV